MTTYGSAVLSLTLRTGAPTLLLLIYYMSHCAPSLPMQCCVYEI